MIPKTMNAMRLYGPHDLRNMEIAVPEPESDEVLCKVCRACVCGTDYAIWSGEFSFVKSGDVTFPMTPGHEWSGVVVKAGSAVDGFVPGDRVVSDNGFGCGRCLTCLAGNPHRCVKNRSLGTVHAWDGAFAEYILIPERHLFHLPENVSFDDGALLEPMTVACSGVRGAELTPGDTVLVNGSGAIGILAAKLCRLCGAGKVFLTGRKQPKLDLALRFGAADVCVNTGEEDPAAVIARNTPSGRVDRVIETSGSIGLLCQSLDLVRPGGTVSALAFYEREIPSFPVDKLVFGSITFRGVGNVSGVHEACLALLAAGKIHPSELISGRYSFEEIPRALEDMKQQNKHRIKWIIDFPE